MRLAIPAFLKSPSSRQKPIEGLMPGSFDPDRSFYRQSIWMVFATVVANVFSFSVNLVAPWMTLAEYGLMSTLLQAVALMMIPAMGLQAVFAIEAASTETLQENDHLARNAVAGFLFTGLIWLAFAAMASHFRADISQRLAISRAAALWVTVCIGLLQLWLPIMMGLLQGRQNFLWFGWAVIANGAGRFFAVVFLVVVLGGQAAGGMTGILLGMSFAFVVCAWHTRDIWLRMPSGFQWRAWLGRVLPLTLGLGPLQFMMSADMLFARSRFEVSQTGLYAIAGVFARGLVILTGPIVAVMFPKVVSSFRDAVPSNELGRALKATTILAGALAVAFSVGAWATPNLLEFLTSGSSPLAYGHRAALLQHAGSLLFISGLIPWFVWSMLPLALSNVLVAYLIARKHYWYTAGLGLIAVAYVLALGASNGSMIGFIKIIGFFNLLYCLLSATAAFPQIWDKPGILGLLRQPGGRFRMFREPKKFPVPSTQVPGAHESLSISESTSPSHSCPICALCSASLIYQGYPGYEERTFFDIYQCMACDTRFIDTTRARLDIYDSIYSTEGIIGYDRYSRYVVQVLEKNNPLHFLASQEAGYYVLYEYLRNKSNLRILDVGCGYGYLTYAMRQQGFEAFGLDVSEAALNIAQDQFGNFFYHADIQTFAEKQTQRYDLIVALELIEHITDPLTFINTLLQLLAPGGVLLLTTPNRDFYGKDAIWHTDLPPVHTMWFGRKGAATLAARTGCGFRIKVLTDWYPKNENKLAKYLGCRRKFLPMPVLTCKGVPAAGAHQKRSRIREVANWALHECGLVRVPCNAFYNRFLQVDETLAWWLWK
jgi:2-polyprenyl-3-methyl-5-hydroxy-6-metoxy-1,4-benzoquinol methylase/O-antigen/teichoic acid export membrane protein